MDWLEASKVSYYKNDEVQKIIDDINQRTNSQMRCCRRELVCLFYDFIWNSPSCYWDNDVCTHFSSRLTTIVSQHPDIIISESMIEHFLSACSTYSQITSIINDLDSINESDSIKNRLYRIPTYTSIVEGCLTNLFRFTVLLIDQFSVQNYSAQRKLEPLRTVLIKNGFSNGIESVDVKIRNSINHGGVIFREDGRVIEFHYMENSKSLSKELTVYEFDDLINKMYDITSAVLLSVCLFLNEHWDKISVNMSQKTFVSFALLSMKLSVPSIRCQFISDTASSKQLNADFYIVETDRTFIVETALKISLMIYSAYPDYDQYYLSFSSERLQKSWIRFTNSELAHAIVTGDFAGIVKSAANRGDIMVFAPSIENVDLHEIKYFRFPNYVSDKFTIGLTQERGDLFGKVGSAVHHRQQDTVYLELGVDLPLYLVYRGEQLFQPFGGQILRLNGNDDPVRSGQRIDREHPQGGLTVDEDMGVLPLQRVQILPQDSLTAHGVYQGYLHTG